MEYEPFVADTGVVSVDFCEETVVSDVREDSVMVPEKTMFVIDKEHLDREWEKQSILTFQLTEENASARLRFDSAKRAYDVTRAEVSLDVRRNPAKYGFANKPTEPAIDALVDSNRSVCEAASAVQKARYDLDMCGAGVSAIDSKRKALEALTQLTAINYYSTR